MIGSKVKNEAGEVTFTKARELAGIVGYAQAVIGKKACYINVSGKGREGEQLMDVLDQVLLLQGSRQQDVEPPLPVFKELKEALRASREQ